MLCLDLVYDCLLEISWLPYYFLSKQRFKVAWYKNQTLTDLERLLAEVDRGLYSELTMIRLLECRCEIVKENNRCLMLIQVDHDILRLSQKIQAVFPKQELIRDSRLVVHVRPRHQINLDYVENLVGLTFNYRPWIRFLSVNPRFILLY